MRPMIVVVDDDVSVRESLDSLLRSAGLGVRVFASAEEFLDSVHLGKADCLISDIRMPGMSGIELHRELLASGHQLPVVFITAHGSDEQVRAEALSDGAVAYLIKPLDEDELLEAVHTSLSRKANG